MKYCLIGDAAHIDSVKGKNIDTASQEDLKKFNKNKKLIKKWAKKYSGTLLHKCTILMISSSKYCCVFF